MWAPAAPSQGLPRVTCAVATSTSGDRDAAEMTSLSEIQKCRALIYFLPGAYSLGRPQPLQRRRHAAAPPPLGFFALRSADASSRLRACSPFCAGESPVRVAFSRSRCSRLSRRRSFAACLSAKESSPSCVSRNVRRRGAFLATFIAPAARRVGGSHVDEAAGSLA